MQTVEVLDSKGIKYEELKAALVPQKDRREMVLVFDRKKIPDAWYGSKVQEQVLPLLSAMGSHSVLQGDYIGIVGREEAQRHDLMQYLNIANPSDYQHSNQYFLVYVNNLSETMVGTLHEGLSGYQPYVGYVDMSMPSRLKIYLSSVLPATYILHKKTVIMPHEPDRPNTEDINMHGLQLESCGLIPRSLQDDLFGVFLTYKIERPVLAGFESDTELSLNAISEQPSQLNGFNVRLDVEKLGYLMGQKDGAMKRLGLLNASAEEITSLIQDKLRSNYLYNLRVSKGETHETVLFNVLIDIVARDTGTHHQAVVALEYLSDTSTVRVVTFY